MMGSSGPSSSKIDVPGVFEYQYVVLRFCAPIFVVFFLGFFLFAFVSPFSYLCLLIKTHDGYDISTTTSKVGPQYVFDFALLVFFCEFLLPSLCDSFLKNSCAEYKGMGGHATS